MNRSTIMLILFLLISTTLSSQAQTDTLSIQKETYPLLSEGGEGTNGGGDYIDIKGIPVLKEFASKAVCNWVDPEELLKNNYSFGRILEKLAKMNWYFAASIRNEFFHLNYCLTGELVKVNTRDLDSVTAPVYFNEKQLAFRLDRNVYINQEVFYGYDRFGNINPNYPYGMPNLSRGGTLIHETIHSFLPMDTPHRNQRLGSTVESIRKVYSGEITTKTDFERQMAGNQVNFPSSDLVLDRDRIFIEYVLSDSKQREDILLNNDNYVKIFSPKHIELLKHLHTKHIRKFMNLLPNPMEWVIQEVCTREDGRLFQRILDDIIKYKEVPTTDPILACVAVSSRYSDFYIKYLKTNLSNRSFVSFRINQFLEKYISRNVSSYGSKININKEMSDLFNYSDTNAHPSVLSLDYVTSSKINTELKAIAKLIAFILDNNGLEEIKALLLTNEHFIKVFSVKDLVEAVYSIHETKVSAEKKYTLDALPLLFQSLAQSFVDVIRENASNSSNVDNFVNTLNQMKLGYELK